MSTLRQGSIRLFRFAGVDVFLHWSWFFVALFEINGRAGTYSSITWNVLEYLALFLIVLLHEYGHALACRQVGGTANQIVLWPMGGVAYVDPPPRPGATLWSIAAGPLVNVALLPLLTLLGWSSRWLGWSQAMPNAPPVAAGGLVHQPLPAAVQHPANLSPGWRPDSSIPTLVSHGTRPQPDGGRDPRPDRGGRIRGPCGLDAIALVRNSFGVYSDELLEGTGSGESIVASGKVAAARMVRLSSVQDRSAGRRLLEVFAMRPGHSTRSKPRRCVRTARPALQSPSVWTAAERMPSANGVFLTSYLRSLEPTAPKSAAIHSSGSQSRPPWHSHSWPVSRSPQCPSTPATAD